MQLNNAETRLWVDLLKEGQRRARVSLTETEESYTVFMLQRFTRKTDLLALTLALAFLEHEQEPAMQRQDSLWETADTGLLVAGLFPERAKRKNVSVSYFTDMSQICFFELASICDRLKHPGEACMYREIGAGVERVAYVLYCTRRKNTTMQEIFAQYGIRLN